MRPVKLAGKHGLTAEMLRGLLHYDPETGVFTRLVQTTPAVRVGDVAGTVGRNGYVQIQVAGGLHYAHRLAWLYMTGEWPVAQVDHLDTNRINNRWTNLREAAPRLNSENRRKAQRNNISGLLGVSKFASRWEARIGVKGQQMRLGAFDTPEEAHQAYVAAKRRLHGGCTM